MAVNFIKKQPCGKTNLATLVYHKLKYSVFLLFSAAQCSRLVGIAPSVGLQKHRPCGFQQDFALAWETAGSIGTSHHLFFFIYLSF